MTDGNLEQISEDRFKKEIHNSHHVTGYQLVQDCTISSSSLNLITFFDNVRFQKLTLTGANQNLFSFKNCYFDELIYTDWNILLSNCECKFLQITNTRIISTVQITEKSEIQTLEVSSQNALNIKIIDSKTTNAKIHAQTSGVSLEISGSRELEDIAYSGCELYLTGILSSINIFKSRVKELNGVECTISNLKIEDCELQTISAKKCQWHAVNIENSKVDQLKTSLSSILSLKITDGEFGLISLSKSIGKLSISPLDALSPNITISDLQLNDFSLAKDQTVTIKNVDFLSLSLAEVNNIDGKIDLSHSSVNGEFCIESSQLGNATLNNLNLTRCSKIKMLNSSFTNAKFFNVQWRKDYRIYEYESEIEGTKSVAEKISKYYSPLRESYRQLISVSNKELNKIDALFFQKQELRIYFEIIKFDKFKSWTGFKDYLILGSNKIFSDFGQDFWLPLKWWLPIHAMLFGVLIQNHDLGISIDIKSHSWDKFWEGFGIYLNLLNPVHSTQINGTNIYGITDFVLRIVAGYFLYYFISATRKFHLQK